jgi:hypothetical protein
MLDLPTVIGIRPDGSAATDNCHPEQQHHDRADHRPDDA